jgi:hypothetical protein
MLNLHCHSQFLTARMLKRSTSHIGVFAYTHSSFLTHIMANSNKNLSSVYFISCCSRMLCSARSLIHNATSPSLDVQRQRYVIQNNTLCQTPSISEPIRTKR